MRAAGSALPYRWPSLILLLIIARGGLAFAQQRHQRLCQRADQREGKKSDPRAIPHRVVQLHSAARTGAAHGSARHRILDDRRAPTGSLTRIVISGCSILVFAIFLFALSWQITLTAIVGSLLISPGLRRLSGPAQELGKRVKRVHQQLGEHMLLTLEGLRTIRAYGQEGLHQQRFVRSSAEARRTSIALTRLSSLLSPLTEVGYLGILCVIIAGSSLWDANFATTLAAVALLYRLQPYTREMESNLLYLAQIEPQLRSVRMMLQ